MRDHRPPPPHPLAKARRAQGLRQLDLANMAGIGLSTIGAVENGRRPSQDLARRLAVALGVQVGDIFPGLGR